MKVNRFTSFKACIVATIKTTLFRARAVSVASAVIPNQWGTISSFWDWRTYSKPYPICNYQQKHKKRNIISIIKSDKKKRNNNSRLQRPSFIWSAPKKRFSVARDENVVTHNSSWFDFRGSLSSPVPVLFRGCRKRARARFPNSGY